MAVKTNDDHLRFVPLLRDRQTQPAFAPWAIRGEGALNQESKNTT